MRLGEEMISEDAQKFLDALKDYASIIGFVGPAAGAAVGYVAGKKRREAEIAKISAEAAKMEIDGEVSQINAITKNFETLIDGYETRIKDLTLEVHALRDEVKQLRKALDARPRV